jgi:hypothetical protein
MRRALGSAELAFEVGPARHARLRQVGIQLKRMPADRRAARRIVDGQPRKRRGKPSLAYVAPGANDVGDDVDPEFVGHDLRFINSGMDFDYARRAALAII